MLFSRKPKPIELPSVVGVVDEGVSFELGDLNDDEMEELTVAFEKGEDFQRLHTNENGELDAKQLHEGARYLLNCFVNFTRRNGHIIVARDKKNGAYLGSICLLPPYQQNWLKKLHFLASVIGYGRPPQKKMNSKLIADKLHAFDKIVEENHHEVAPLPHWYVVNLGVVENAQGRGVGKALLSMAQSIAQQDGLVLYLECHNGNVAYYEKRGYQCRRRNTEMIPKSCPSDKIGFNAMVLEPK